MSKKGSTRKTMQRSAGRKPTGKHRQGTNLQKPSLAELGTTTRKTIEVPQLYFYQVKMAAVKRRMKEKQLWAEILTEYFQNHPVQ